MEKTPTIRFNTFETNSSSSHALVMDPATSSQQLTTPAEAASGIIKIALGNFGWEWARIRSFHKKLTYLCTQMGTTTAAVHANENWTILSNAVQYLTGCTLQLKSNTTGGIDHDSQGVGMALFSTSNPSTEYPPLPDALLNFLRNPNSYIETGNDNSFSEETLPSDMTLNPTTQQWELIACEEPFYPSCVRPDSLPKNSVLVSIQFGNSKYVLVNGKRVSRTHCHQVRQLISQGVLASYTQHIYDPLHTHTDRRELAAGKQPPYFNPLSELNQLLSGYNGLQSLIQNTKHFLHQRTQDNRETPEDDYHNLIFSQYQLPATASFSNSPETPPLTTLLHWTKASSAVYSEKFDDLPASQWLTTDHSFCYAFTTHTLTFWAPPELANFFNSLPNRPVPTTAKKQALISARNFIDRALKNTRQPTEISHLTSASQQLTSLLST